MDRKLVGMLSLLGAVMGVMSVLGWTQHREGVMWLVIGVVAAIAIALKAPGKFFMHGLWTGVLCGVLGSLIQLALFSTYLANNPDTAVQMQTLPANWNPRVVLLVSTPFFGLGFGLLIGLLSLLASKVMRRQPAPA